MTPLLQKPGLISQASELDLGSLPMVDCHLHTSWTDGDPTVNELYRVAVDNGLATILYSEHSRKTSTDWFPRFAAEVRALPSSPCRAYVGTECKVDSVDGALDTVPAISDLCDFVLASVHRFPGSHGTPIPFEDVSPNEAVDLEFNLTWAMLANPLVDIVGHLFGMSYRRFKVTPSDDKVRALIARAAVFGVAVEINARYHPDPHQLIRWCRELDARITFGSDAHKLSDVGAIVRRLKQDA
jgi:histidinol phosphatase-like PHP family hydrolase